MLKTPIEEMCDFNGIFAKKSVWNQFGYSIQNCTKYDWLQKPKTNKNIYFIQ